MPCTMIIAKVKKIGITNSVATIQSLIHSIERGQENFNSLEKNIKQKIYKLSPNNHRKVPNKKALK